MHERDLLSGKEPSARMATGAGVARSGLGEQVTHLHHGLPGGLGRPGDCALLNGGCTPLRGCGLCSHHLLAQLCSMPVLGFHKLLRLQQASPTNDTISRLSNPFSCYPDSNAVIELLLSGSLVHSQEPSCAAALLAIVCACRPKRAVLGLCKLLALVTEHGGP